MTKRVLIGYTSSHFDYSSGEKVQFSPNDAAFRHVVIYLAALHGFVMVAEVYHPYSSGGTHPWSKDDTYIIDGPVAQRRLIWSPHEIATAVMRNTWPRSVQIDSFPADFEVGGSVQWGVADPYLFGIGQAMLTNFVEAQKRRLADVFGTQASWPDVWQFAGAIRNAMSHGGGINIRNGRSVTWKGLRYGPDENGKPVINCELLPGDLLCLMREMEEALPPAGI